jgi:aminoglycoside phosphotransferase (APT) family kinase protein
VTFNNLFLSFQPNFIEKIYNHVKTDNDKIQVLNHGDLWTNNMMFTYNGKTPTNVIFVDYQLSFYSTPGIDLNYFMWTCPSTEVRKNHWADLIREYYNTFLDAMVTLKARKIPSFDDMKAEIQRRYFYGRF